MSVLRMLCTGMALNVAANHGSVTKELTKQNQWVPIYQGKSVGCSSNCEWTCSANVNGFTACREVLFWISSFWTELQLCLSIRLTRFLSVKVNMMPFHVIMNTHRVAILSISLACVTGHQGSLLRMQVGRCQCWWTRVSHNYWYYIEWQEQNLCFKRRGWGSAAAAG